jgi:hypothetical protein
MEETSGDENVNYLGNFWQPRLGSRVYVPHDTVNSCIIIHIDPDYPEQVKVDKYPDEIFYLQDCVWCPTNEDMDIILQCMGITIGENLIRYDQTFQRRPNTVEDYAQAIRSFRLQGLAKGVDIIDSLLKIKH